MRCWPVPAPMDRSSTLMTAVSVIPAVSWWSRNLRADQRAVERPPRSDRTGPRELVNVVSQLWADRPAGADDTDLPVAFQDDALHLVEVAYAR